MGIWSILASFFLRNRGLLIFIFACITLFLGYFATKVSISYEFAKLLPDNDSTLITYQNFKNKFGEDGAVMVIGIEDKSFFELQKFNDWGSLAKEIKSISGIQEVVCANRIFSLQKNDSLGKFEFSALIKRNPYNQAEMDYFAYPKGLQKIF